MPMSFGSRTPNCILVVANHPYYSLALASSLGLDSNMRVVGAVSRADGARGFLPHTDIAVIDLDLPNDDGLKTLRELKTVRPDSLTLILTQSWDSRALDTAVQLGASGILDTSSGVED
jgi:DNA-binding NarL/FixJ family response regulator